MMGHGHDHSHTHAAASDADGERRLFRALLVTGGFMAVEVIGGVLSGSLALLADAGHMFGDFVALALAWMAFRISSKSPDLRRSFGYHRFQVLAAFVNGVALCALAAGIIVAAIGRLFSPHVVLAGPMLLIALIGLVVNIIVFRMLSGGQENINTRGAALHVLGDLLGSVAAIAASLIIMTTGWMQADPILSFVAAALIVRGGYQIVRHSGHILLEGTPEEVDPAQVGQQLMSRIPAVIDVHHVHIWSLTDERPVLTLHARVTTGADHDLTMIDIHRALESLFGVSHATVQLEYGPCTDKHNHD